jgi:hypothetical protein
MWLFKTHVNPSVKVGVYITTSALGGVVSKFTVLLNAFTRVQRTKADNEGVISTELEKRTIKNTHKNSGYVNTLICLETGTSHSNSKCMSPFPDSNQ